MTNITQTIRTNNSSNPVKECVFFISLKEMREQALWHILMFINEHNGNNNAWRLSLLEHHNAIHTVLKNIALGTVLALGKHNRDGTPMRSQHPQPFLYGDNKESLLYELLNVLNVINDETLSNVPDSESLYQLTRAIFASCENKLIDTMNQQMSGFFPNPDNLIRVACPSDNPDGDICIVLDISQF